MITCQDVLRRIRFRQLELVNGPLFDAVNFCTGRKAMRFRLLLVVHRHLDVATTAHMHTATLFRAAMLDMNFFADRLFALIDKIRACSRTPSVLEAASNSATVAEMAISSSSTSAKPCCSSLVGNVPLRGQRNEMACSGSPARF